MLNTISVEELDRVVGGCGCSQGGGEQADPSQQQEQQPQQQAGGEQQQGPASAEQILQSIAGLIGQFMQQRGGQQQG